MEGSMPRMKICPICHHHTGFISTRCSNCGYDHSKNEFEWIKVDVKYLKVIASIKVVEKLISKHREKFIH